MPMPSSQRFLALDIMRGITIALMIFVNFPGSWSHIASHCEHAAWIGLTPPDFVFPFFLFMIGTSMSFSFKKFEQVSKMSAFLQILKRGSLLFIIGFLIHAFPFFQAPISEWRVMGVLQRIGLCYVIAGALILWFRTAGLLIFSAALLVLYYDILQVSHHPYDLLGNIVGIFDTSVLGTNHLWDRTNSFDPEGILSSLPAVVNIIMGFFAGNILKKNLMLEFKINRIAVCGLISLLIGLIVCIFVPISKNLWTPSFVLITSGAAFLVLFLLVWIIDIQGYKAWAKPFEIYGTNALFAYCIAELWAQTLCYVIKIGDLDGYAWIYQKIFLPLEHFINPFLDPIGYTCNKWLASEFFAITHVIVFFAILYPLYKFKIFIKI